MSEQTQSSWQLFLTAREVQRNTNLLHARKGGGESTAKGCGLH
jgi:hypothetical protein